MKIEEDNFWSKVDIGSPDDCWEWTAARSTKNYGAFSPKFKGPTFRAHRVSWALHNKMKIPNGILVCHRCDNPPCCNPNHLFLGTHKMNNDDKASKGRAFYAKGEDAGQSKLSESSVLKIRGMIGSGKFSQRSAAELFLINQSTVSLIVTRKTWKHI